jgi:hypothetical protein
VAYTYTLNSAHRLVIIRNASSKWTGADILASAEEVTADDDFAPDYDWIYDLRFIHGTAISVVELERIVERFRTYRDRGVVAGDHASVFVGTDDDLRHAAALFRKRSDRPDDRFAVVETPEEARRRLGIDASATEIGLTE